MYYSNDGAAWNKCTTSVGNNGVIAFGNGKFVCIQDYSDYCSIHYSTDGVNWTTLPLELMDMAVSITFGNNKFVAVSGYGQAYVSTDGINWGTYSMPRGEYINIAYGNNMFVATGYSIISYSPDGINWSQVPGMNSETYRGLAYGNGKFVCGGTKGTSHYSEDGINWSSTSSGIASWYRLNVITFCKNKFVASFHDAASTETKSYILESSDGINWSEAGEYWSYQTYAFAYGDGVLVSVGYNKLSYGEIRYKPDESSDFNVATLPSIIYNPIVSVAYGNI